MSVVKIACIQTNSTPDPDENIASVSDLIREASASGAQIITTPEVVGMLEPNRASALSKAEPEENHRVLRAFRELACELDIWLLIGSISIKISKTKLSNRSFLINSNGEIVARYSKIHMFDVEVGDGNQYMESKTYEPGAEAVIVDTPWGLMGLTICYDIRFPHLFRDLAKAGARVIFSPAAFTKLTGEAHWHILQRARAIENGCFIVSPAQVGMHANARQTYGHSLVVDPWGSVLADGGNTVGYITADIDLSLVQISQNKVPSLLNDRCYIKAF